MQLFKSVTQRLVIVAQDRVEARKDHRLDRAIAMQRLSCRVASRRNGIAHLAISYDLQAGSNITDFARLQAASRGHEGRESTYLLGLGVSPGADYVYLLARLEFAVYNTH